MYREWVPYDYTSSFALFCFTYIQQSLSTFLCAIISIGCDCFICGFLMHICCQIEILEHRMGKLASEEIKLSDCVRHHNRILESVSDFVGKRQSHQEQGRIPVSLFLILSFFNIIIAAKTDFLFNRIQRRSRRTVVDSVLTVKIRFQIRAADKLEVREDNRIPVCSEHVPGLC